MSNTTYEQQDPNLRAFMSAINNKNPVLAEMALIAMSSYNKFSNWPPIISERNFKDIYNAITNGGDDTRPPEMLKTIGEHSQTAEQAIRRALHRLHQLD